MDPAPDGGPRARRTPMNRSPSALRKTIRAKMRKLFFDVSPDGILVYLDPIIGTLENTQLRLQIRTDFAKKQFELEMAGDVEKVISWNGNIRQACEEAFVAYFRGFRKLCEQQNIEGLTA
jgi:hypothetical protein